MFPFRRGQHTPDFLVRGQYASVYPVELAPFSSFCLGRLCCDWFGSGSGERLAVSVGSDLGGVLWWVWR